jgi:ornithine cyclodeaminase/alanine dehydrogenase-like protein (mu-crystallin family)
MALLISDEEVRRLIDMRTAVDVCELAIKELQLHKAENRPRQQFYASGAQGTFMMRQFQGAVPSLGAAGLRVTTDVVGAVDDAARRRPFGIFLLFDLASAALLAVIHDHELQRLRVGAETGVAARCLGHAGARTVGLLGSGYQAATQLAAVCAGRAIERTEIYSPTAEHRSRFAWRMEKELEIAVVPVDTAREAVENKDLVLASTNASTPVLDGTWLSPGAHVTSIVNSDRRYPRRELDNETFARAAIVAIGSLEQSRQDQAADISEALAAGALDPGRLCDLGEILTGQRPGRENRSQITVFKNNGLAVEFSALAWKIYQLALAAGAGETIPDRYFPALRR